MCIKEKVREMPKHPLYVYICTYVHVHVHIYVCMYVCIFFKLREVSDRRDDRSGFVKK